jgi:predicted 3-demethylubiquinone-9 3-methyltransferase (glyoxalase superfamily)
LWNAIVDDDGEESACRWCKDKWVCGGRSRRARSPTPSPTRTCGREARPEEARMGMKKIDVAAIEAAPNRS